MGNFIEVKTVSPSDAQGEEYNFHPEAHHQPGVYEYNSHSGEVTKRNQSVSTADMRPFKEGILSTLSTKRGMPVTDITKIDNDSRVTYHGIEMTIAQARTLGLVSTVNGAVNDTVAAKESNQVAQAEQAQMNKEDSAPVDFAGAARETLNQITKLNGGNPNQTDALFNSILGALNTEDINGNKLDPEKALEKAANTFLRNVNDPELTPELSSKMVSGIMEAYSQASAKYISKNHGVSGDQVLGWAAEALKPNEKTRVYRSVYHGDKRVLDALVSRYKHAKAKENNYV